LSVASLISYIYSLIEDLEIEPIPEILGLIPNHFNQSSANHVGVLEAVSEEAEELELKVYSPIKTWQYLNNSALYGKALKQLRSNDPMARIFAEIIDDLLINQ
jgi:chromosome partitioning protein